MTPTDAREVTDQISVCAGPASLGQSGVMLTIEYITGFELFNTRPYHNYETQGYGFRVTGPAGSVEAEELLVALNSYYRMKREKKV